MKLITQKQYAKLLDNGRKQNQARMRDYSHDFFPVVKLFTLDAAYTWLLTEIDPNDKDIAFGLCDLGLGFPELGTVSLSELRQVRGRYGLPVERDRHFKADKPLSRCHDEALQNGYVW